MNLQFNKNLILNFIILIIIFKFVKADLCTIKAICECNYKKLVQISPINPNSNSNLITDNFNLCTSEAPSSNATNNQEFMLNCTYIDFKVNSTDFNPPKHTNTSNFILDLQYPCPVKPPAVTHYSTGTILIIIFFTIAFSYLGLGIAVNYFLVGARGLEMIPNLDFWRDFPALVLDGAKFIQNGCKARPSDLTSPTGQDGYDAI